jgi:hypothetical protein
MVKSFHRNENFLSSQWFNLFIAMKTFFHRDEKKTKEGNESLKAEKEKTTKDY